jgi:hypothetical protein
MKSDWREGGPPGEVAEEALVEGVRIALLAAADPDEGVSVSVGGPSEEAVAARSTVTLSAADVGRSVLVVFEGGDPRRPIVVGVLQDAPGLVPPAASGVERSAKDVRVNGKRVSLEAEEEITLRCGRASISLRADGRIVIKGMDIVSRARGTHKVKGATVLIN